MRQRDRVRRPRAAAQHLVLAGAGRTPRSTRGYGNDAEAGVGVEVRRVHSHTSPTICSTPHALVPTGRAPTASGPKWVWPRLAIARSSGRRRPTGSGASRRPDPTTPRTPTRLRSAGACPAQRAYASASYQHTCCTGSAGDASRGRSVRPKRRTVHAPLARRARQNCGCARSASWRHFQPVSLQWRGSSYPPSLDELGERRVGDRRDVDAERRDRRPRARAARCRTPTARVGPHHEPAHPARDLAATDRFGVSTRAYRGAH